jgi:hypothetical protein
LSAIFQARLAPDAELLSLVFLPLDQANRIDEACHPFLFGGRKTDVRSYALDLRRWTAALLAKLTFTRRVGSSAFRLIPNRQGADALAGR